MIFLARWRTAAALAMAATLTAACASSGPEIGTSMTYSCVDDSPRCIAQRQATMKGLMADKSHAWVKQPASVDAHASGVRLFALKSRKKDLSCDELQHAKREADNAPQTLRGPQGKHLTLAQVSRGAMLATEVSRELQREINARCRRG